MYAYLQRLPVPAKLKLFWSRVNSSRLTVAYFIIAVLHCVVQVVFQVQAFTINAQAASFLSDIVAEGNATADGFFVFDKSLRFCDHVPSTLSAASCQLVWSPFSPNGSMSDESAVLSWENNTSSSSTASSSSSPISSQTSSSAVQATSSVLALTSSAAKTPSSSSTSSAAQSTETKVVVVKGDDDDDDDDDDDEEEKEEIAEVDDDDDDDEEDYHDHRRSTAFKRHDITQTQTRITDNATEIVVHLHGLGLNRDANLSVACLEALNWPIQMLDNTKREDIAFIAFQFWVLGMSLVALLNESIPHVLASLVTHMSATAWGGFQIQSTSNFHSDFQRLSTNGACKINLLPQYWKARGDAEIPSLALNAAVLLVTAGLSWRLIKSFGWQTFKRVGASLTINRIYKLVLTLSIAIQLSLFFVVASVALWLDQLCNGAIGHLARNRMLFKILLSVVIALLVPWLLMGWFAVRRELRTPMVAFLVLSCLYIAGWGGMFDSPTFRWTFVQWQFFSAVVSLSLALIIISLVLGIVCRMNFGRGLPRYLNAEEPLPGDDYSSSEKEKIDFPSNARPVPTFSAAFGSGSEVPPPRQMRFGPGPRQMGPRFSDTTSEPFETQSQLDMSINSHTTPNSAYSSPIASPPMSLAPSYYRSNVAAGGLGGAGTPFGGLQRSSSRGTVSSFGYSASDSGHSGAGWNSSNWSPQSQTRLNTQHPVGKGSVSSGIDELLRSDSRGSSKSGKSTASAERARWVIE